MSDKIADRIVEAMALSDTMEEILILYRMKSDANRSGVGWIATQDNCVDRVTLMEEVKYAMFMKSYGQGGG